MLRSRVYVGKQVWDRRDNAVRRERNGSAPWRAEDEWTVCEGAHEPIISEELFGAAQERVQRKADGARAQGGAHGGREPTGRPRGGRPEYLLSGMVRCATAHPSLSAFGITVNGHSYYRCRYSGNYGQVAAKAIPSHGVTFTVREDTLLP